MVQDTKAAHVFSRCFSLSSWQIQFLSCLVEGNNEQKMTTTRLIEASGPGKEGPRRTRADSGEPGLACGPHETHG
jgi:hypothetical protein